MTKMQFILSLSERLSCLSPTEKEERLNFYSEMIEDRIEEGLTEEEAVTAVGTVDEIAAQIIADNPQKEGEQTKESPKRRIKAWEIILLVLGCPIWLSLLIAAFAVALSLYVSLWSVIISLWAVFGSLVGCIFGGMAAGIIFFILGSVPAGILMISAASVCAGLSIFMFYLCKIITKGTLLLTKKIVKGGRA